MLFSLYQVKRVNRVNVGGLTCPVRAGAVPVVEGAAEHGVFSRLQHHVAADKPPHGAAAVSQQAAERRRPRAVVGNPKQQHAQIQQVALCCVPSPEDTGDKSSLSFKFNSVITSYTVYLHYGWRNGRPSDCLNVTTNMI